MRLAALFVLLGVLASTASAYAGVSVTATHRRAKFKVFLKVVGKPCVIQAPSIAYSNAAGSRPLRLASVLSNCELDGAPATLTVHVDPADKGTNVATINF